MNMHVPDDVRHATTKCPKDFSCLSTGQCDESDKCGVRYAVGQDLLLLASDEQLACPYSLDYGYYRVCACPTHFAIRRDDNPDEP